MWVVILEIHPDSPIPKATSIKAVLGSRLKSANRSSRS